MMMITDDGDDDNGVDDDDDLSGSFYSRENYNSFRMTMKNL